MGRLPYSTRPAQLETRIRTSAQSQHARVIWSVVLVGGAACVVNQGGFHCQSRRGLENSLSHSCYHVRYRLFPPPLNTIVVVVKKTGTLNTRPCNPPTRSEPSSARSITTPSTQQSPPFLYVGNLSEYFSRHHDKIKHIARNFSNKNTKSIPFNSVSPSIPNFLHLYCFIISFPLVQATTNPCYLTSQPFGPFPFFSLFFF